jgi:hypothetical protein
MSVPNRQGIANRQHQEAYFAYFLDVNSTNILVQYGKQHQSIGALYNRNVSSTLPIWKAVAFSIRCRKAETEINFIQDGGKIKRQKDINHHVPKHSPTICHLGDPPRF